MWRKANGLCRLGPEEGVGGSPVGFGWWGSGARGGPTAAPSATVAAGRSGEGAAQQSRQTRSGNDRGLENVPAGFCRAGGWLQRDQKLSSRPSEGRIEGPAGGK